MSDETRKATVAPGQHDNGENRPGCRLRKELRHSSSRSWRAPMGTQPLMCIMALLTMLALGAGNASAQQTDVCSNTPMAGERIYCREEETSTEDIDIDTSDLGITTTGSDEAGILAHHLGDGNIDVNSESDMFTSTGGPNGNGIWVIHNGATGDVVVRATNTTINVGHDSSMGISAFSQSFGKLDVDITGGRIETSADSSSGAINIQHEYSGTGQAGATTLDIGGNAWLITMGDFSPGVSFRRLSDGPAIANLEDVTLSTMGDSSFGIFAKTETYIDLDVSGDLEVNLRGGVGITTEGSGSHGVYTELVGEHATIGSDAVITATGANSIETMGHFSSGLFGFRTADVNSLGKVRIDVQDIVITTHGYFAHGIRGEHYGVGDIDIDVRNATIKTESTDIYASIGTLAFGIFANGSRFEDGGDIDIDVEGGSIETQGKYSYGIRGDLRADNGGEISITTSGGNTVTTTGDFGHGIVAYHFGTAQPTSGISIEVGGSIDAIGAGAQGVRVGTLISGAPARVAAIGADGYRQQTVTVNGAVTSAAEGVYLAGGGRVVIGPGGSITSDSGIAILATGTVPEPDPNLDNVEAIPPKLYLDMNLDGRRVAEVIGDDWIINDGGETTIVVNDVKLHDGATGVVRDASAPNGAFDVTVKDDGRTVTDRSTSPWTISQRFRSTIADRDFSAEDFTETMPPPPPPPCVRHKRDRHHHRTTPPPPMCPPGQVGTPPDCTTPPPPMCPPGQVGTPPDCTTPPPQTTTEVETMTEVETTTEPETPVKPMPPTFMEEYAPRAAVYEAMPGFLLRIDAPELSEKRIAWADSPVWARLSGGRGSYGPERASVGAQFDYSRFAAEAGLYVSLGKNATGSVSVRHVKGSADVSAPTGGGEIEAEGLGFSLGASLNSANDYYARGRISLTNYSVDLSSDALGSLKNGVGASVNSLDLEAGKRMRPDGNIRLTPRVWMTRSTLDVDDFTDTVDARVSLGDAVRLVGGAGVVGETALDWQGGALTLRGSVDLALTFGGAETSVEVSGTKLSSEAPKSRLLLGLGGTYRRGSFFLDAEVSVGGPSSGDALYSGRVTYGWEF